MFVPFHYSLARELMSAAVAIVGGTSLDMWSLLRRIVAAPAAWKNP
jgi:hypothetical protein